jgi:hypothetical protein
MSGSLGIDDENAERALVANAASKLLFNNA